MNFLVAIAQHLFISCLVVFILALIAGSLLFYKYVFLTQKIDLEDYKFFEIREDFYNEVMQIRRQKESDLKEVDSQKYSDPFKGKIKEQLD